MRPSSNDRNFDAEMIVVADGEFREDASFPVVVTDCKSGETVTADLTACALMGRYAELKNPCLLRLSGEEIDRVQGEAIDCHAQAAEILNEDLLDIILNGRVKMAFLIDSDGGDGVVLEEYQRAADYVNYNGGLSQSYIFGHAFSAGFELMTKSREIYAMDRSHLGWHFSELSGERRRVVQSLRQAEPLPREKSRQLDDLFKFLGKSPYFSREMKDCFMAQIVEPDNHEGELEFTGQELYDLKIIHATFARLRAMKAFFDLQYMSASGPLVKDFWGQSLETFRQIRHRRDWRDIDFEEKRAALKTTYNR
jgi:hypothetical protein